MTKKEMPGKDQEFAVNTAQHMKEVGAEFTNNVIGPMLISYDLNLMDTYYIAARLKAMMEEKYNRMDFSDETILKLREAMLKSNIKESQSRKVSKPEEGDEQAERCEPACRRILKELLSVEFLLSDESYLPRVVQSHDEILMRVVIDNHINSIDSFMEILLRENKRRADVVKWDGKEPEEITWRDIDKVFTP